MDIISSVEDFVGFQSQFTRQSEDFVLAWSNVGGTNITICILFILKLLVVNLYIVHAFYLEEYDYAILFHSYTFNSQEKEEGKNEKY